MLERRNIHTHTYRHTHTYKHIHTHTETCRSMSRYRKKMDNVR